MTNSNNEIMDKSDANQKENAMTETEKSTDIVEDCATKETGDANNTAEKAADKKPSMDRMKFDPFLAAIGGKNIEKQMRLSLLKMGIEAPIRMVFYLANGPAHKTHVMLAQESAIDLLGEEGIEKTAQKWLDGTRNKALSYVNYLHENGADKKRILRFFKFASTRVDANGKQSTDEELGSTVYVFDLERGLPGDPAALEYFASNRWDIEFSDAWMYSEYADAIKADFEVIRECEKTNDLDEKRKARAAKDAEIVARAKAEKAAKAEQAAKAE